MGADATDFDVAIAFVRTSMQRMFGRHPNLLFAFLSFIHAFSIQAAILYNLKVRHMDLKPYTRTGNIMIACNPYYWIPRLYSPERRQLYSRSLVWEPQPQQEWKMTARKLPVAVSIDKAGSGCGTEAKGKFLVSVRGPRAYYR